VSAKKPLISAILSAALAVAEPSFAETISQQQLVEMFSNMRANPSWNVDGPLLWGYFFTAPKQAALEPVAKTLAARGYRLVGIYAGDKASPSDPDVWWLHVERVEKHTVDSLQARNGEFYGLARKFAGVRYDGMDVGPVP
jgi:Regulator of ribonuclease activity B